MNNSALRGVARDLIPPLALKLVRQARLRARSLPAEWEVLPGGFEQARRDAKIKGWNRPPIGEIYARDLKLLRDNIASGVPLGLPAQVAPSDFHAVFNHNLAATWGWVLGRAVAAKSAAAKAAELKAKDGASADADSRDDELSVLDWGGALGHYFLWARALQPDLTLNYTLKEMPVFAKLGAELLPEINFRDDASVLQAQYDLTLASCSFHYEENWRELLPQLLNCTRHLAFLQRIPICENSASFVYVQRPYVYGYQTEYPSWCFNRAEFAAAIAQCGWQVERETVTGERFEIKGASEFADYRGFLLKRA